VVIVIVKIFHVNASLVPTHSGIFLLFKGLGVADIHGESDRESDEASKKRNKRSFAMIDGTVDRVFLPP